MVFSITKKCLSQEWGGQLYALNTYVKLKNINLKIT